MGAGRAGRRRRFCTADRHGSTFAKSERVTSEPIIRKRKERTPAEIAIGNGDYSKFGEEIAKIRDSLITNLVAMRIDYNDADDIVQEACDAVLRHKSYNHKKSCLQTFMFMVTKCKAMDAFRRKNFHRSRCVSFNDFENKEVDRTVPSFADCGEMTDPSGFKEESIRSNKIIQVRAFLDSLDPSYAEVLQLIYSRGDSIKNIGKGCKKTGNYNVAANYLGIPLGTVKSKMSRALAILRSMFAEIEPEDMEEPAGVFSN